MAGGNKGLSVLKVSYCKVVIFLRVQIFVDFIN